MELFWDRSGSLAKWSFKGAALLSAPPTLAVFRAPFDNDSVLPPVREPVLLSGREGRHNAVCGSDQALGVGWMRGGDTTRSNSVRITE